MQSEGPSFAWPAGWVTAMDDLHRRLLLRELFREMPKGHLLFGRQCTPLGVLARDPDWMVLALEGEACAAVHLTWNVETDPRWPYAVVYKDLGELFRAGEWE